MPSDPRGADRTGALGARLGGHGWTILSSLRGLRWRAPTWNWGVVVEDATVGLVRLTGRVHPLLSQSPELLPNASDAQPTVVVVHGLAGSAASGYVDRLASAAIARGWSVLSLNLRGADGLGEDLYHAGLGSDLEPVLASLPTRGPIYLVGFSLGGHLVLRYLSGACRRGGLKRGPLVPVDPRVRAAVTVCPPLDLTASVEVIDGVEAAIYRRYLLRRLNRLYDRVASRRGDRARAEQARRVSKIRDWDDLVVAPRYGFDSAEDYYRSVSVAPVLHGLSTPSLVIAARNDPMVPASTLEPWLDESPALETAWAERGGHVAIPRRALGLGSGSPERQMLDWLAERGGSSRLASRAS